MDIENIFYLSIAIFPRPSIVAFVSSNETFMAHLLWVEGGTALPPESEISPLNPIYNCII